MRKVVIGLLALGVVGLLVWRWANSGPTGIRDMGREIL